MTAQSQSQFYASHAYRQAAVSVSPTVAVVRLYDRAILSLTQAIAAVEAGRLEEAFIQINKVSTILRGLRGCLDHRRGGAMAEQLSRTYSLNILALHSAFGKPDAVERYTQLLAGLRELGSAWAFVAGLDPQR